jgi:TP901 family phage tail tape measure protein
MAESTVVGGITIPIFVVEAGGKGVIPKLRQELKLLQTEAAAGTLAVQSAATKASSNIQHTITQNSQFGKVVSQSMRTVSSQVIKDAKEAKALGVQVGESVRVVSNNVIKDVNKWDSPLGGVNTALNQLRWTMVNVAFAGAALGALAAPFVKITKGAMAFEHELRKIQAVTGSLPDDIQNSIMLSKAGRPFAREDVSKTFLEFSRAGFSAQEVTRALPSLLDLSQIGFMDTGEAAKTAAQMIRAFNLSAAETGHIVDVLSTAADSAKTDVQSLSIALSYVATVAEGAGQSFESTVALVQILQDAGLSGSKAGTGLRQVLASLIDPSEKARNAMIRLGISFTDSSGNIKELTDFLVELKTALLKLSPAEAQAALGEMFQVRALASVSAAINRLDELGGSFDVVIDRNNRAGAAFVKNAILQESSLSQVKTATEAFRDAFLDSGKKMGESSAEMIQSLETIGRALSHIVQAVASFIDKISSSTTATYAFAASLVVVGGALAMATGGLSVISALLITLGVGFATLTYEVDTVTEAVKEFTPNWDELNTILHRTYETGDRMISTLGGMPGVLDVIASSSGDAGKEFSKLSKELLIAEKEHWAASRLLEDAKSTMHRSDVDMQYYNYRLTIFENTTRTLDGTRASYDAYIRSLTTSSSEILYSVAVFDDLKNAFIQFDSAVANSKLLVEKGVFGTLLGEDRFRKASAALSDTVNAYDVSVTELKKYGNEILSAVDIENQFTAEIFKNNEELQNNFQLLKDTENQIETLTLSKKNLTESIKQANKELSKEQSELTKISKALSDVHKRINNLKGTRFVGETQTLGLLSRAELFRKREELAALGVLDAQNFINEALSLGNDEYDGLFARLSKINSEMTRNKNAFEAWQESIKTAIRAEVEAGEALEKDVTGRVKQWQTALLGISTFQSGKREDTALDDWINKLQLAYDVHFGGMHDEVKNFLDTQQDRETGVFESSNKLISALEAEFSTRSTLNNSLEKQQDVVDLIANDLEILGIRLVDVEKSLLDADKELIDYIKGVQVSILALDMAGEALLDARDNTLLFSAAVSKAYEDIEARVASSLGDEETASHSKSTALETFNMHLISPLEGTGTKPNAFSRFINKLYDLDLRTNVVSATMNLLSDNIKITQDETGKFSAILVESYDSFDGAVETVVGSLSSFAAEVINLENLFFRSRKQNNAPINVYGTYNTAPSSNIGYDYYSSGLSQGGLNESYLKQHGFISGSFNDFIMRPGSNAVSFSPQDTIIGVKDTSLLGGGVEVNIGSITIEGSNSSPDEIANAIAVRIKRGVIN